LAATPAPDVRYEEDKVVILFEDAGYKSLVTSFAIEKGLLRAG
jgi:hypothetical protein